MLSKFLKQTWLVMVAALVFGLLVAGVHGALKQRIADNARKKLEGELKNLLTGAASFKEVKDESGKVMYRVGLDEQGKTVGYAMQADGGGFADKIVLLITLDAKLDKLLGIAVLKSNETPGFGDKIKDAPFKGQFTDCPVKEKLTVIKTGDRSKVDREIVAITGATISSDAVTKIVNDAVLEMKNIISNK